VLEETDDYLLSRDRLGRTMKLCKGRATIALPQDHPVHDMASWESLKPMFIDDAQRLDWDQVQAAKRAQDNGSLITANIPGGFDLPRQLMGEEGACLAFMEQPELIRDILDTARETACKVFQRLTRVLVPDQLSVHEDLAGRSGPLIGPRQVEGFLAPYFRPVWELLRSRGARLFQMDTDGNITAIIDALLDAGINCLYPMEPQAGMDVVALRAHYGTRLSMLGGIDKFALRRGREAIEGELSYKMQPSMRGGGMVFALDHRIPNGTPLDDYRWYVQRGRELLGLPAVTAEQQGWARMAF